MSSGGLAAVGPFRAKENAVPRENHSGAFLDVSLTPPKAETPGTVGLAPPARGLFRMAAAATAPLEGAESLPSTLGSSNRTSFSYLTQSTMHTAGTNQLSLASGGGRNLVVPRTGLYAQDPAGQSQAYATPWVSDEAASHCFVCDKNFGFWIGQRKHHCRACGNVVCHTCSRARLAVLGLAGRQRVCDECVRLSTGASEAPLGQGDRTRGLSLACIGEDGPPDPRSEPIIPLSAEDVQLPPALRTGHVATRLSPEATAAVRSIPPEHLRDAAQLLTFFEALGEDEAPAELQAAVEAIEPQMQWWDVPTLLRSERAEAGAMVAAFLERRVSGAIPWLPSFMSELCRIVDAREARVREALRALVTWALAEPEKIAVPLLWSLQTVSIGTEVEDGPASRVRSMLAEEGGDALAAVWEGQRELWGEDATVMRLGGSQLEIVRSLLQSPAFFEHAQADDGDIPGGPRRVVAPFGTSAQGLLPSRSKTIGVGPSLEGGGLAPLVLEFECKDDGETSDDLGSVGYQLLVRRSGGLLRDMLATAVTGLLGHLCSTATPSLDLRLTTATSMATWDCGGIVEVVPESVTLSRLAELAAQINAKPGTGVMHYLRSHARSSTSETHSVPAPSDTPSQTSGFLGFGPGSTASAPMPPAVPETNGPLAKDQPGTAAHAFDTFARSAAGLTVVLHLLGVPLLRASNVLVTRRGSIFTMALPGLLQAVVAPAAVSGAVRSADEATMGEAMAPMQLFSNLCRELGEGLKDDTLLTAYLNYCVSAFGVARARLPLLVNAILTHPWCRTQSEPEVVSFLHARALLDPQLGARGLDGRAMALAGRLFVRQVRLSARTDPPPEAKGDLLSLAGGARDKEGPRDDRAAPGEADVMRSTAAPVARAPIVRASASLAPSVADPARDAVLHSEPAFEAAASEPAKGALVSIYEDNPLPGMRAQKSRRAVRQPKPTHTARVHARKKRVKGRDCVCADCSGTYFSVSGKTTTCMLCRKRATRASVGRNKASTGGVAKHVVCGTCRGVYWSGSGCTTVCARCRRKAKKARAVRPRGRKVTYSDSEDD